LSRKETHWTLIYQAHGQDAKARQARDTLLQDYYGAVYRYFLGATRDPDAAKDLAQEFALRFIEGGFRRADPDRGRFRDYLKTSLIHMTYDFRQRLQRGSALDAPETLPDPSASDFEAAWTASILERTWAALEQGWKALESDRPAYHALLELLRVDPTLRSPQIVESLSVQRGIHVSADWVRQAKKRAWASFANHLIDEVACSLGTDDLDMLAEELSELDLLKYCRSALDGRRRQERS